MAVAAESQPGAPPVDPDEEPGYVMPTSPSELQDMSDEAVFAMLRKVAFANAWDDGAKVQFEAMARSVEALREFRDGARRNAHATFFLTAVLVLLILILIAMTGVLVWLTTRI
jgi:hypothetical protein